MRNTTGSSLTQLHEFNDRAWRELVFYSPESRKAGRIMGFGVAMIALSATSLVNYAIFRKIGAVFGGAPGPVPATVWWVGGLGILVGSGLLLAASLTRRRLLAATRFTEADIAAAQTADRRRRPTKRSSGPN